MLPRFRTLTLLFPRSPVVLAVFFQARDPKLAAALTASSAELSVLIKGCTSFTVIESESEIPVGCVGANVSSRLAVHLLLKGVIDVDVEMNKAEKKKAAAQASYDKLAAGAGAADYEQKKPEHVRQLEAEKVSGAGASRSRAGWARG